MKLCTVMLKCPDPDPQLAERLPAGEKDSLNCFALWVVNCVPLNHMHRPLLPPGGAGKADMFQTDLTYGGCEEEKLLFLGLMVEG